MAVSGSKNYSITGTNVIAAALRKIGAFDQGETIPSDESSAALQALNLMVKEWAARGAGIWLRSEVTVFLQPETEMYSLGTGYAATSFVETTLSADEAAAQTGLSVASETGISVSDFIGIKLDDDSIHWSTVSSLATLTIASGLASAASSGNKVYAFTTKAGRPQKILSAFRRDVNGFDTPVGIIGSQEYQDISDKDAEGEPSVLWYQPVMDTGSLYVWPVDPGSNCDKLILIAENLADDFDAASDNPQFPIEWGNCLIWNLAAELAAEYGISEREQGKLWQIAEHKLTTMLDYDVENASVTFSMGG